MTPDPLHQVIQLVETAAPPDATIDTVREMAEARSDRIPARDGMRVTPVSADGVPAAWVTAPPIPPRGTILYLHGGAYISGSRHTHEGFCSHLAAACEARVLVVDYRLAPEHPFPAALDDALAAYLWLVERGHNPAHLVVMGDSAGGGLALALTSALKLADLPLPGRLVLLSPWADLALSGASMYSNAEADPWLSHQMLATAADFYLQGADPTAPLVSPVGADYSGFPPLLTIVGEREVLLDDAYRVTERARAHGVEAALNVWPGMIHVFPLFAPLLPEATDALNTIAAFVHPLFE